MGLEKVFQEIYQCLIDLDRDCVLEGVKKALDMGASATSILLEPMSRAMNEIGRLYEEGEYFIAELIEAASIFKDVLGMLEDRLVRESKGLGGARRLTIVIGTVKGDVHDIGKTIVATMLQAQGHRVIDLGVDVSAEKFVEAVKKYNADVVGMSALLTTTARYMREIIEKLEEEGLRSRVFVVVGGAATSREFAQEIGADAWAKDAVEAVKLVEEFVKRVRGRR
ncbi:MAG: corrinoid protein [Desulfurococcales archaeon]|nr:corrinoid protein [Desulfurococcales archaeon]